MLIMKLMAQVLGEIPNVYAKGGKGSAPAPIATPPPVAPEPETQATLEEAPQENDKAKKKAQALGSTSLAIPLGAISTQLLNK